VLRDPVQQLQGRRMIFFPRKYDSGEEQWVGESSYRAVPDAVLRAIGSDKLRPLTLASPSDTGWGEANAW
jgi:hypothetical protein